MASAVLVLSTSSSLTTAVDVNPPVVVSAEMQVTSPSSAPSLSNTTTTPTFSSWKKAHGSFTAAADPSSSGVSLDTLRNSGSSASHFVGERSLSHRNGNQITSNGNNSNMLMSNSIILEPPVVAAIAVGADYGDELHLRKCRYCHTVGSMHEDWRQGDRVCTACGVVDEERLMDDRPEWKEFAEAEDIIRANAAGTAGMASGRSGLVPTDDSKYLGGLQPTTLSQAVYGGGCCVGGVTRKRLVAANRKINKRMEQMHARELQKTKLSRHVETLKRTRQQQHQHHQHDDDDDYEEEGETEIRPEYEQLLLQEEEEANRLQSALYADKWSLQRAIRMFGAEHEQTEATREHDRHADGDDEDDDETTKCRKDSNLRKASQELYCAYSILLAAAQQLHLPDRVTNEAISMLCRYAARRDGLKVRGVASTLKQHPNDNTATTTSTTGKRQRKSSDSRHYRHTDCESNNNDDEEDGGGTDKAAAAAAAAALREYNKMKQMGALTAALLFCTARNLGWPRTIVDVCNSIRPAPSNSLLPNSARPTALSSNPYLQMWSNNNDKSGSNKDAFIKRKHVSRAMTEIKELFPDFARITYSDSTAAALTNSDLARPEHASRVPGSSHAGNSASGSSSSAAAMTATANFLDHVVRKLQLPPVAVASIRALVIFWWHQDGQTDASDHGGGGSSKNLTTVCAALTYFVSLTGNIMQSLALQACRSNKRTRTLPLEVDNAKKSKKSRKSESKHTDKTTSGSSKVSIEDLFGKTLSDTEVDKPISLSTEDDLFGETPSETEEESPFDVFSKEFKSLAAEQKEYEMRRVWDAWNNQLPWLRSLLDIEQSCGVPRKQILEYYKTVLFPKRLVLLTVLKDSVQKTGAGHESIVVNEAPLASVLLPQVVLAAPLLKEDGK